jgi:predicted RNA-binding Zn-ribbon protein involved in translation (DUF1610 family)
MMNSQQIQPRLGAETFSCPHCNAVAHQVPDQTVRRRGFEHHTYVCSACHMTERKSFCVLSGDKPFAQHFADLRLKSQPFNAA